MGWGVLGDIAGGARDAANFVGDAADDVGQAFDDAMDAAGDAARSVGNAVSNASISDIGHTALDAAGMVPVIGEAADLANAGWYLAEGDKTNAALSAASAIPLAGNFATGAKWARKGVDAVDMVADGAKAVDKASDAARVADNAGDVARAGDNVADAGAAGVRPSWRNSELDVGAKLDGQGYQAQKSFKDGVEVPYGTRGSVRPEYYKPGSSIEVKNYNVETAQGRSSLTRNVSKQAVDRADNLPAGTKQEVFIDVRGQNVSRSDLNSVVDRIVDKSNGAVQAGDINILR